MSGAGKAILNVDRLARGEVAFMPCCWDDCERQGVDSNRTLFHDHAKGYPCSHPEARHVWYVFCSERHRQLFLHGHREYGKLPSGYRLSRL